MRVILEVTWLVEIGVLARLVGHPISIPLRRIVAHSLTQAEATDKQLSRKIDRHLPLSIPLELSPTTLKIPDCGLASASGLHT